TQPPGVGEGPALELKERHGEDQHLLERREVARDSLVLAHAPTSENIAAEARPVLIEVLAPADTLRPGHVSVNVKEDDLPQRELRGNRAKQAPAQALRVTRDFQKFPETRVSGGNTGSKRR